ncbi:hypothetical protein VM636_23695 [Streptomyces sp. SCSIO 75703]|uniref:hypothetical protein n=1 Tax=unclassified Streptomyces TaxID=2593676 RepID=UPI0004BFE481|nr:MULTISPECIES: hypothetical protein [unclassified Streptomyces]
MSAPLYPRPRPATRGGAGTRLPWWALALPVLTFLVLLLMVLNPSQARAAAGEPVLAHFLHWARHLTLR